LKRVDRPTSAFASTLSNGNARPSTMSRSKPFLRSAVDHFRDGGQVCWLAALSFG
jgi:hypothetical protein